MAGVTDVRELRGLVDELPVDPQALFGLFQRLGYLLAIDDPEARELGSELVIRLNDKRDQLAPYAPVIDELTAIAGLHPYVLDPTRSTRAALLHESHRPLDDMADDIVLHEAQAEVYRLLMSGQSVALSAPTSFGKSLLIDALVASGGYSTIVVIVPTLALIDETRRRLSRYRDRYKVVTHPSQRPAERTLYILTQERAIELQLESVDLFIIDEFYKLAAQDGGRADILNLVFYRLLKTGAQYYLLGPNVAGLSEQLPPAIRESFVSLDVKTVATNTFRIKTSRKTEREALVDVAAGLQDPSIVYCRSIPRTTDVANWLLDAGIDAAADEAADFAAWVGTAYHPDWIVAKALTAGIGIHNAHVPRAVGSQIVRMFNDGLLRFLVCTSTLIEGVNTAAKNVLILDNKVARRKYDYFTYSNIRGRSGRMFQHFVGNVYVFQESPEVGLPYVDIPVLSQSPETNTGLLVQLDEGDLSSMSRRRLDVIHGQNDLSLDTIKANIGIDPDAQIALARKLRRDAHIHGPLLAWTYMPTYAEIKHACNLIWNDLNAKAQGRSAAVGTSDQLTYRLNGLRTANSPVAFIKDALNRGAEPDKAVAEALEFLRQWASFVVPRYFTALGRIQDEIFGTMGRRTGDYSNFLALVENWFLPPPALALEEFGIPIQVIEKLVPRLKTGGDLDGLLASIRAVPTSTIERLEPVERGILRDALETL